MTAQQERFNTAIQTLIEQIGAKHSLYIKFLVAGAILITCGAAYLIFVNNEGNMDGLTAIIVLFSLLPCIALYHALNFFYKRGTKHLLVETMAEAAGMIYEKDGVMALDDVLPHKILPPADAQSSEDGFTGTYHDVHIDMQEVRLTDISQQRRPAYAHERRAHYETIEHDVFWGLVVRLRLRKPMEGHTIVMPRSKLQTALRTKFSEFSPVNLVAPKWKKQYDVMSTDQVEARVIMNPAFIERFMEARKIFRAKWMEASFKGNEILFSIHRGRDLFEAMPLWKAVTEENLRKITREIEIIFEIIDVLKLNKQIGF